MVENYCRSSGRITVKLHIEFFFMQALDMSLIHVCGSSQSKVLGCLLSSC